MDTGHVQVLRIRVTRDEINYDHPSAGADIKEALAAIVGGSSAGQQARAAEKKFRLPLAKENVSLELSGVPTAVANALRRAVKDEIRGRCLTFDRDGFDRKSSTDPFMEDDFIRTRIRMIPLRPQISETIVKDLRFALDAVNTTDRVMLVYSGDLVVTAGSLSEPLFNPTHEIAFLQPGRTLRITNIRLVEGHGTQDAAFIVGVRAVSRPLDLAEAPREDTHARGGKAAERSGFLESSLVSNPRRHEVSVDFPAVPAGGRASLMVLSETCDAIKERLRFIQNVLTAARIRAAAGTAAGSTHRANSAYFLVTPDGLRTKGVLGIRNETDTIGHLLARAVYELTPDIGYVGYTYVSHEKMMKLTVAHAVSEPSEIESIVTRAVRHAHAVFVHIQRGIKEAF